MMTFIWISLILIIISVIGLLIQIFIGPTIPDRLIALDAFGVVIISATALLSILFRTSFFMEIILLIAIMSFIGTIAFSKFIERGEIIERDNDS